MGKMLNRDALNEIPLRVLLVQDNESDQFLFKDSLLEARQQYFLIEYAGSLQQARDHLSRLDFDVIVVDFGLPDAAGFETLAKVREINRSIPIVIVSGLWDEHLAEKALRYGAKDYVVKNDVTGDSLYKAIQYAVKCQPSSENVTALYDELTGVPNRLLLHDYVERTVSRAKRNSQCLGLLMIDIDHFKHINASLGFAVGDQLLKKFALRMVKETRKEDMVSRLEGNRFSILIHDVHHADDVALIARKIKLAINKLYVVNGFDVMLTASIGISVYPESDENTLIHDAKSALSQAKSNGGNCYQFNTMPLDRSDAYQINREERLSQSLKNREFSLNFLPQVDLSNGKITSMEALLRWQPEGDKVIPPDEFIFLAERAGLMGSISEWVLKTAVTQCRFWHLAGMEDIKVSVNISTQQLKNDNFICIVKKVLQESGLAAQFLSIEVGDKILGDELNAYLPVLFHLRKMGVTVCLDDYGAGLCSIAALKDLPINQVKIDKSLIKKVLKEEKIAAVIRSVIMLAHELQITVVAEGVETSEQLGFLNENDVDMIQGFFMSKPLSANESQQVLWEQSKHRYDS